MKPRSMLVPWTQVGEDWCVLNVATAATAVSEKSNYTHMIRMRQWCRDNCHHPYSVANNNRFAFSDAREAFRFKLSHGDIL